MPSNAAEIANEAPPTSNPLDAIPDEIPFDVPYGRPISLEQAQGVIHAAVAEAKQRNWKMNIAVADSGGNLVAFQRMDGAMLASIQIAEHKARAAVTFRRPTKVFEDGINLMHLNYLLAFDGVIASRGGIPLIDQGKIIGAIGCSGGTDSQDEVVSKAGAAVVNKLQGRVKDIDCPLADLIRTYRRYHRPIVLPPRIWRNRNRSRCTLIGLRKLFCEGEHMSELVTKSVTRREQGRRRNTHRRETYRRLCHRCDSCGSARRPRRRGPLRARKAGQRQVLAEVAERNRVL